MNKFLKHLIPAAAICLSSLSFDSNALCPSGTFPNPITDVCWDCMFPIVIGSAIPINGAWGGPSQEDYDSGVHSFLCTCPSGSPLVPPRAGLHVSFWEPVRTIDVTRTPYCLLSLGGGGQGSSGATSLNLGGVGAQYGADTSGDVQFDKNTMDEMFRQTHWFIMPWMTMLQVILGDNCLTNAQPDIMYMSEVDPSYTDESLDRIMNPEDYLLGGIIADATCVIDAVQSDITFGNNLLWWCDGTNGPTGNLTGSAPDNYGFIQGSTRYVHKTVQKLYRLGVEYATAGPNGMCGYYPQIVMDKRMWKYQMLYPSAQSHPDPVFGHCCQPMGRSTDLWGAGRTFPINGEDFIYGMFRKRDCCQGPPGYGQ